MKLESLANELLLYIFEFFDAIDLLRVFYGINSRFNGLLFNNFQKYYINLQRISKQEFELACQQYIPLIKDRIASMYLSDDDDTPQQSSLFLHHFSSFHQFPSLRSLSFYRLRSEEQVKQIILACRYLPHLTHLSLIKCSFLLFEENARYLINIIWSLPNLTYCLLTTYVRHSNVFYVPTVTSLSLKNVCIKGFDYWNSKDLIDLMERTPHLKHLDFQVKNDFDNQHLPSTVTSMMTLKIIIRHPSNGLKILLQNMPNLRSLTVRISNREIDGYQWEEIIDNHLPKLKIFRLLMRFKTDNRNNKEEIVDRLLGSFRSPFWLDKHQWFVRGDWSPSDNYSSVLLYTLPYAFEDYDIRAAILSKSTCFCQNHDDWSYDRVSWLSYDSSQLRDLVSAHVHFSKIRYLSVTLPFDDQFWSVIPRFDQLVELDISLCNPLSWDTDIRSQLQALLNRAPCLYSLVIRSPLSVSTCIFEVTSLSVRRLRFLGNYQFRNASDMHMLICSPLGTQCEVLQMRIEDRLNVSNIITGMVNLRALKFKHRTDPCNCLIHEFLRADRKELIVWLPHRLLSLLTITISPGFCLRDIRIWIR